MDRCNSIVDRQKASLKGQHDQQYQHVKTTFTSQHDQQYQHVKTTFTNFSSFSSQNFI